MYKGVILLVILIVIFARIILCWYKSKNASFTQEGVEILEIILNTDFLSVK